MRWFVCAAALLVSCYNLNNPLDPKAANYAAPPAASVGTIQVDGMSITAGIDFGTVWNLGHHYPVSLTNVGTATLNLTSVGFSASSSWKVSTSALDTGQTSASLDLTGTALAPGSSQVFYVAPGLQADSSIAPDSLTIASDDPAYQNGQMSLPVKIAKPLSGMASAGLTLTENFSNSKTAGTPETTVTKDLGLVSAGTASSSLTISIINNGDGNSSPHWNTFYPFSRTVSASVNSQISITSSGGIPDFIIGGQTVTIAVTLTPTGSGSFSQTLTIPTSDTLDTKYVFTGTAP